MPESAEDLELRVMLDGNVTAIVADGDLNITGDSAANSVEVTIINGDVVVQGLNGTTVNGGADPFVAVAGSTRITGNTSIRLASGNDLVAFSNEVTVGGNVSIFDVRGTSEIGILNSSIEGNLHILTGGSADDVVLSHSTVSGLAMITTLGGNDTISFFESTIGGPTHINTGGGNDAVVLEASQLNSRLSLFTGRGEDDVVFTGTTVKGNLLGLTGSGNDLVMFDDSNVGGRTTLLMLRGNDTVLTQNTNEFSGRFWAGGILGKADTFQASEETTFSGGSKTPRFESATVDPTTLDQRLNDDPDGVITRSDAARASFGDLLVGDFDLTAAFAEDANIVDSNGIPLTKDETLTVEGITLANGTVNVDADGDGEFDDGTTQADADGNYAVDVTLGDNAQTIMYQVTDSTGRQTVMTAQTSVHKAIGTVVQYVSSLGTFDVELLDADAPITVANFLTYLDDYTNSIVHRSPQTQFVQGGEFTVENDVLMRVETPDPDPDTGQIGIDNEFNPANSNIAGTLAMALQPGIPTSGNSGWFFNTADNSGLDADLHTVFGRVIGNGLEILTAIDQVTDYQLDTPVRNFQNIPLRDFTKLIDISGTVTVVAGETTITGTDTLFATELEVGQIIQVGNQQVTIETIVNDTELTITTSHVAGATDATAVIVNNDATEENYVIFSSISEILT